MLLSPVLVCCRSLTFVDPAELTNRVINLSAFKKTFVSRVGMVKSRLTLRYNAVHPCQACSASIALWSIAPA